MRRMHYADAGWAQSTGAAADTYGVSTYWTGPGGWVYLVSGATGPVVAVWSPTSKREINVTLSTQAAGKVRSELRTGGAKHASKEAAFAAVGATVGGLSAYLPSFPAMPGLPTTGGLPGTGGPQAPGFDLSAMDPTKQPWFWPAVIGVGGVIVLFALKPSPKRKSAKPASAFRAMFG
jgi:hypothetical protein